MTAITNLPDLRPSLLLDFANSRRVDPRIQCTRSSTATCIGPDGKLRTVAANVPRIDYDPDTGKCLGLLVEESRTNLAYPSNMPTSTVQTVTGVMQANGATKITSGVLAPDGSTAGFSVAGADVGTNSGGANNVRAIGVLAAVGTYTISFWLKRKVGSPNATVTIAAASSASTLTVQTTDTWKQVTLTVTTTATASNVIIYSASGTPFDMWGFQVEAGAFATSYIPTTASAVTRAADAMSVEMPDAVFSVIVDIFDSKSAPAAPVISIAGASGVKNWRLILINNATLRVDRTTSGGSNVAGTSLPLGTTIGSLKVSLTVSNVDTQIAALGTRYLAGAYSDMADSFVLPRYLHFGKTTTTASGYIGARRFKSLALYNTVLSQAQLQRLTA